ncbi:hypothetical protein [Halomonas sp. BC04]|nr:hypothetical protein [Halomonas sp. BC04]
MAIEQGIWKLADSAGEPPLKLRAAGLADEGCWKSRSCRMPRSSTGTGC